MASVHAVPRRRLCWHPRWSQAVAVFQCVCLRGGIWDIVGLLQRLHASTSTFHHSERRTPCRSCCWLCRRCHRRGDRVSGRHSNDLVQRTRLIENGAARRRSTIHFPDVIATLIYFSKLGILGSVTLTTYFWCLPAVVAGTWLGLRLFDRIDDTKFRRVVLIFLLISGVTLVL